MIGVVLLPDANGRLLTSPVLSRLPGMASGFTTRAAGSVSPPGGPRPDGLSAVLGAAESRWRRRELRQVHGSACIDASTAAPGEWPEADALVATGRGDLLVVRTADCASVLVAAISGPRVAAVAALHAGWRGLLAGVVPATAAALRARVPDGRLVAAIGPTIGACCFEVGGDVASPFEERYGRSVVRRNEGARPRVDLPGAVTRELASVSIAVPDPEEPPCTRCNADLFESWRRDGAAAGRTAAFIGLEP